MSITTLGKYLLGSRQAILDVAAGRHVLWLGLLFVCRGEHTQTDPVLKAAYEEASRLTPPA